MSTPNTEVFDRFLKLIEDKKLCNMLTDAELTYHLEYFLNESASVYFKKCKKDLSLREVADFHSETFTATAGQTEFTISSYPTDPNENAILLSILVDDVVPTYTFDVETKTFSISDPVLVGDESVVCGYDFVGQFTEDLTDEELWILAHGMVVTWNSGKVYAEQKLKNALSTTDYKTFSPAELLKTLISMRELSLKEIKRLTVSYSYNNFTGFN